jgi:hypothetical protein
MNNLYIVGTEFKCPKNGKVQYGYRIYNDGNSHYETGWDSIPQENLDLLKEVVETCEIDGIKEMLVDAASVGNAVCINDEWYTGKQVALILAPVLEEEGVGEFAGNYVSYEECVANGSHLKMVDNDGYCQFCGEQQNGEEDDSPIDYGERSLESFANKIVDELLNGETTEEPTMDK